MPKILAALVFLAATALPALAGSTIDGFLYVKLGAIGTRSEGPAYYLQPLNGNADIFIRKHTMLWQPDPVLQPHVGTKVKIEGQLSGGILEYSTIRPLKPSEQ